jgi:hypothetical protein
MVLGTSEYGQAAASAACAGEVSEPRRRVAHQGLGCYDRVRLGIVLRDTWGHPGTALVLHAAHEESPGDSPVAPAIAVIKSSAAAVPAPVLLL